MPDFSVKRLEVGPMAANCYIVWDNKTKNAFLIDPGGEPARIKETLKKNGLKVKFIINTHGHGDHILGNGYFKVPIYIHRLEKDYLTDPSKNLSGMFGLFLKTPAADRLLEDGDRLSLDGMDLEIIHTPGHSPGGIAIKLDGVIFTGDTLFAGSIGRTDLLDGDEQAIYKSIRDRLFTLDDNVMVYPGHGPESTIGEEKRSNPFFN